MPDHLCFNVLGMSFQNCRAARWAWAGGLPPNLSQHPGTPPSVPLSIIIDNLLPFKYSELIGSSYLYTFLRILRWESFFLFSFPFTDRSLHFLYMFICLLLVEVCNRYAREGLPVGVGWPPSRNNCTVKWPCPWQLSRDGGSPCVVCALCSKGNFRSSSLAAERRKVYNTMFSVSSQLSHAFWRVPPVHT